MTCTTDDTSLDECPFAGWGVIPSHCTHSMDVQLTCRGILHQMVICVLIIFSFLQEFYKVRVCGNNKYKNVT